jgi:PLP dependent protein
MSLIDMNLQGVNKAIDDAFTGRQARLLSHTRPKTAKSNSTSTKSAISVGQRPILVAVSKTKPTADIRQAFAAGQRHFGENYVQEAVQKVAELADLQVPSGENDEPEGIVWHMIGPLQSNKAKLTALHMDWVHSVDRPKIADALNSHRAAISAARSTLNVLAQVNISGEASKSGVATDALMPLLQHIAALPYLRLRGLMTIVENVTDEAPLRKQFQAMYRLYCEAAAQFESVDTLSMGMSQDYRIAIDEGATMVRVGSAIFGVRTPQPMPMPTSTLDIPEKAAI